MVPFIPPNVQHVFHVILACAVAVFVVLKSDPTLGALPWVVGIGTVLGMLNAIFTSTPGDAGKITALKARVAEILTKMGPAAVLVFAIFSAASAGCLHAGQIPQPVIDDFAGLCNCIVSNMQNWETLIGQCSKWTVQEIEAAIAWLTANPQAMAAHPEWMPTLRARLLDAKAHQLPVTQ